MRKTGALTTNTTKKGLTPREIKAELVLRGVCMKEIADQAGVSLSAVAQAIHQYPYSRYKGLRLRPYIAQAIGRDIDDIWPA